MNPWNLFGIDCCIDFSLICTHAPRQLQSHFETFPRIFTNFLAQCGTHSTHFDPPCLDNCYWAELPRTSCTFCYVCVKLCVFFFWNLWVEETTETTIQRHGKFRLHLKNIPIKSDFWFGCLVVSKSRKTTIFVWLQIITLKKKRDKTNYTFGVFKN